MRDGLQRLLLRESDDANNFNANEDYSATKRFLLTPASTDIYILKRLIWTLQDSDAAYNKFGNLAALTTGCRLVLETSAPVEQQDLLGGLVIKSLADLLTAGFYPLPIQDPGDGTSKIIQYALDLDGVIVRGPASERLAAIYADNLVGLDVNTILAEVEKQPA